jgi:uncharacterized membrane protein YphA (DoxX/SURF4 family)
LPDDFVQRDAADVSIIGHFRILWDRADERAIQIMTTHGLRVLRVSLGIVFLWFGLLKVIGVTPVANLVQVVIYWVPVTVSVPLVGLFEMILGVGLLSGLALRLTLLLLWLHLAGTFLVLVIRPDLAFQGGNPLFLTTDGEFVIKNLVLITAGIAVGSTVRSNRLHEQPTSLYHARDPSSVT